MQFKTPRIRTSFFPKGEQLRDITTLKLKLIFREIKFSFSSLKARNPIKT